MHFLENEYPLGRGCCCNGLRGPTFDRLVVRDTLKKDLKGCEGRLISLLREFMKLPSQETAERPSRSHLLSMQMCRLEGLIRESTNRQDI